jgi:hypothetical protein
MRIAVQRGRGFRSCDTNFYASRGCSRQRAVRSGLESIRIEKGNKGALSADYDVSFAYQTSRPSRLYRDRRRRTRNASVIGFVNLGSVALVRISRRRSSARIGMFSDGRTD